MIKIKKTEENKNITKIEGGKTIKMEEKKRKKILWIVIGVLFIAVLFLTFKVGVAGNAVQSTGSAAKSVVSSGMVGGC